MNKCRDCLVPAGKPCYGETFPLRCDRADYRAAYLRMATEPPRPPPPRHPENIIRVCPYGSSCGCATRKCYAVPRGGVPTRVVTVHGDCAVCVRSTVIAERPAATRANDSPGDWWGWAWTC